MKISLDNKIARTGSTWSSLQQQSQCLLTEYVPISNCKTGITFSCTNLSSKFNDFSEIPILLDDLDSSLSSEDILVDRIFSYGSFSLTNKALKRSLF